MLEEGAISQESPLCNVHVDEHVFGGPAAYFQGFVGIGRKTQVSHAEILGIYGSGADFAGM